MFRIRLAAGFVVLLAASAAFAAGIGERCGGIGGIACDGGSWCEPPAGTCGGADLVGTCVDIHRRCHHNYHAVCGCDGVTYGNDCARQHESMPLRHAGRC